MRGIGKGEAAADAQFPEGNMAEKILHGAGEGSQAAFEGCAVGECAEQGKLMVFTASVVSERGDESCANGILQISVSREADVP